VKIVLGESLMLLCASPPRSATTLVVALLLGAAASKACNPFANLPDKGENHQLPPAGAVGAFHDHAQSSCPNTFGVNF
jgi:hypothetical protein